MKDLAVKIREVINNPKQIKMTVLKNKSIDLYNELLSVTSFLPDETILSDRLLFVESGISNLIACKTCGNMHHRIVGERPNRYVGEHCSLKCYHKDSASMKKRVGVVDQASKVEKMKATNQERYGSPYQSQREENKEILRKSKIVCEDTLSSVNDVTKLKEMYLDDGLTLVEISEKVGVHYSTISDRLKTHGVELRKHVNRSSHERIIEEYLKGIDIPFKANARILSGNREVDFLIPSRNLCIEVNGLYWHSHTDYTKSKNHLKKMEECKDLGYKLLQFTDLQISTKLEIVKSMINNSIGVHQTKIRASKCEVRTIDTVTSKQFLNDNHISGHVGSQFKYGLFHGEELVSVMTFSKSRYDTRTQWEIIRLCSKLNHVVHGAASKLFNHAVNEHNIQTVMTYADRMIGQGKVYENLGFTLDGGTSPNYVWTNGNVVLSRYQTMKQNLSTRFLDYNGQPEREFMVSKGYGMFHDCGSNIYVWKRKRDAEAPL